MTSKWETRERNTKRLALAIALLFHILVFAAISASTSGGSFQDLIEHVFGHDQPSDQVSADNKV